MQTISIGRDSSNDVVMNDTFISRKHAQLIILDNGQILIKDLGSSNGTFVNESRVSECYLKLGDTVKCASIFLNWQQYAFSSTSKAVLVSLPVGANQSQSSQMQPDKNVSTGSQDLGTDVQEVAAFSNQNQSQGNTGNFNHHKESVLPIQQNVIVMGKAKSVGMAFFLAFFFGPLGLLYASVTGGIIMFILSIPILIFTAFMGIFFINPICSVWAVIAANQANAAYQNRAGGLINNNFQR